MSGRRIPGRGLLGLVPCLLFALFPARTLASGSPGVAPCRLPEVLPVAEGVPDPVFAVLLGLMEADACGILTRGRLEREVRALHRPSMIPVQYLHVLRRTPGRGEGAAEVALSSITDLDLPVPYRILGYHPGRVRASEDLLLEEWQLGTLRLGGDANEPPIVLENVRLWGIRRGRVEMDVDGWLDGMLGGKLDDMRVGGFALLRYQGRRIGLALGYSPEGAGRSGSFDFGEDTILFPSPAPLKRAAVLLRSRLERLMPKVAELRKPGP